MTDLSVREEPGEKRAKRRSNAFVDFLASAGGAAAMTILLGGVVGQLVSCDVQRRVQQREFNNGWLKSRGDQALVARKEYVDGRRAALDEILRTIGAMAAASDSLIDITQPSFTVRGHKNPKDGDAVFAEQTRVAVEFTNAERAWQCYHL